MAQDNCQKIKLLKLYELLQQETDERNPMTTRRVIERLGQMGISCDRRTLAKDMALLNEYGYEVMSCWDGKEKGYYVEDRSFSVPELKILMDAVQAANFITDKKTEELINKIAALGGSHQGAILKSNMVCFNTRKHRNEQILYSIGYLEEALQQKRKVIFRYFDLNERGEKVYRREGHHYVVEPIALVFNEDNYYLVVYSARHDGTANYRVDKMERVEVLEEPITEKAVQLRDSVGSYTEQAFKMFAGKPTQVTLHFPDELTGVVHDRFGEETPMARVSPDMLEAVVRVQISPTFWGWIFQFGGKMQISEPDFVKAAYHEHASGTKVFQNNEQE